MTKNSKLLRLERLKQIYGLRKTMRTYAGALDSFQTQIYSINGTINEVRSLLDEISCDIREMDVDLKQIKEALNKK